MSGQYSDPRYGTRQLWTLDRTGALNGTVGATVVAKYNVPYACTVSDVDFRIAVGGTEASLRQLLVGYSSAGTGTTVNIGTQALGTLANNTVVPSALTSTTLSAGDYIVISHLGTGAGVYDVQPVLVIQEKFVNA